MFWMETFNENQKLTGNNYDSFYFVDINRQSAHIFGEDPSQYVDEVKQRLRELRNDFCGKGNVQIIYYKFMEIDRLL